MTSAIVVQRNRAVFRTIRQLKADLRPVCPHCHCDVKYMAPASLKNAEVHASGIEIICNLYDTDGVWLRTVHYHEDCYNEAGQPYGKPSP